MGMHISGEINTDAMLKLSLTEIGQLFDLKTHEEYEIQTGIKSERHTVLYSLAEKIRKVLHESAAILRAVMNILQ
jgi:hypothetical protein